MPAGPRPPLAGVWRPGWGLAAFEVALTLPCGAFFPARVDYLDPLAQSHFRGGRALPSIVARVISLGLPSDLSAPGRGSANCGPAAFATFELRLIFVIFYNVKQEYATENGCGTLQDNSGPFSWSWSGRKGKENGLEQWYFLQSSKSQRFNWVGVFQGSDDQLWLHSKLIWGAFRKYRYQGPIPDQEYQNLSQYIALKKKKKNRSFQRDFNVHLSFRTVENSGWGLGFGNSETWSFHYMKWALDNRFGVFLKPDSLQSSL